jgi:ABC-type nitrate/sulfonate/bicarbonate transport system ATPase subunit
MIENNQQIKNFITENDSLFWWIKKEEKENISINLLVETILNYGNEKSVKKLFDLVGIENAAEIFYGQISGKRVNYNNRTINYFKLYFQKHVQKSVN